MAKFKRTLQISVLSAIMFFCGVMGILLGARTGVGKVRAEEAETVHIEYVMTASDLMNTSKMQQLKIQNSQLSENWITRNSTYDKIGATLTLNEDEDGAYITATTTDSKEGGDPQLWYYDSLQKIKFLSNVEITYRLKSAPKTLVGRFYFFGINANTPLATADVRNYAVGDQWNTIKVTLPEAAFADEVINVRFDYLEVTNEGDSIDIKSIKFSGDVGYEELTVMGRNTSGAQFDYYIDTINGDTTNATNKLLDGWTYETTEATDFTLNGWIVVKSVYGLVKIDHYEYKINDGAWTAIEGGIGSRSLNFEGTEIPNETFDASTAGIANLIIPTASLGKGVYTVSLRAITTNYKTVTMSFTYNCQYLVTYEGIEYSEGVTAGEKAMESAAPQKEGYTVEWLLNGEKYDFNSPVVEDITLQAEYKVGKIESVSLSLEGDIAVNLYIALPDGGATAVLFTLGENTAEIPVPDAADGDGRYKFSFGVAAKDYTEAIGVSVIPADETEEGYAYDGLTVKQIANVYLNGDYDDEVKAVVTSMLAYCESARAYFAGETVTEVEAPDLAAYAEKVEGNEDPDLTVSGAALVLESQTSIKVYFSVQGEGSVACTIDGEEVAPVLYKETDGVKYYYIEKENIAAKELGTAYVFEIGSFKVTYSAMSYAYTMLKTSEDTALKNAVIALYNYYLAADTYFNNQEV